MSRSVGSRTKPLSPPRLKPEADPLQSLSRLTSRKRPQPDPGQGCMLLAELGSVLDRPEVVEDTEQLDNVSKAVGAPLHRRPELVPHPGVGLRECVYHDDVRSVVLQVLEHWFAHDRGAPRHVEYVVDHLELDSEVPAIFVHVL